MKLHCGSVHFFRSCVRRSIAVALSVSMVGTSAGLAQAAPRSPVLPTDFGVQALQAPLAWIVSRPFRPRHDNAIRQWIGDPIPYRHSVVRKKLLEFSQGVRQLEKSIAETTGAQVKAVAADPLDDRSLSVGHGAIRLTHQPIAHIKDFRAIIQRDRTRQVPLGHVTASVLQTWEPWLELNVGLPDGDVDAATLQTVMTDALAEIDENGIDSVVIKSLGVGVAGERDRERAEQFLEILINGLETNPTLRRITISLDDPGAFDLFDRALTGLTQSRLISSDHSAFPTTDSDSGKVTGRRFFGVLVSIAFDDIAKHTADAIVNPTRVDGEVDTIVGDKILNAAGVAVRNETDDRFQNQKISQGGVIVTSAGGLKAKYLLHVARKNGNEDLSARMVTVATTRSLREATALGVQVLAIPAFVWHTLPFKTSARSMLDAIAAYLGTHSNVSLTNITIVVENEGAYLAFVTTLDAMRTVPSVHPAPEMESRAEINSTKNPTLGGLTLVSSRESKVPRRPLGQKQVFSNPKPLRALIKHTLNRWINEDDVYQRKELLKSLLTQLSQLADGGDCLDLIIEMESYLDEDVPHHLLSALTFFGNERIRDYLEKTIDISFIGNVPLTLRRIIALHPDTRILFRDKAPRGSMLDQHDAFTLLQEIGEEIPYDLSSFVLARKAVLDAGSEVKNRINQVTRSMNSGNPFYQYLRKNYEPHQIWDKAGLGAEFRDTDYYENEALFWNSSKSLLTIYRDLLGKKPDPPLSATAIPLLFMLWKGAVDFDLTHLRDDFPTVVLTIFSVSSLALQFFKTILHARLPKAKNLSRSA